MRANSGADDAEYRRPENEEIPTSKHDHITLKLTGARAVAGIELGALDGFLTHLLAVLRDYDRLARGEDLRKSGSPEAKAAAAVALRLVSLRPGSAIAELEPVISQHQPYAGFDLGDAPRAVQVVDDLLDHVSDVIRCPPRSRSCAAGRRCDDCTSGCRPSRTRALAPLGDNGPHPRPPRDWSPTCRTPTSAAAC